jgi:hypothetical protein
MDDAGVDALRDAIKHMHGVDSRWLESVPVKEIFQGAVVWDGEVQVFELVGHKAKRAYAWSHATEGAKRKFYAVLELPPVDSAVTAVRVAIAAG